MKKGHINMNSIDSREPKQTLRRGIVQLYGVIDHMSFSDLKEDVYTILDDVNKDLRANGSPTFGTQDNPIVIDVCSEGGEIYPSIGMYDFIVGLRNKGIEVDAMVQGYAASAACMIVLQAVRRRKSTTNSRFLLHEAREWGFSTETTSTIKDKHQEFDALQKLISRIIGDRAGKTQKEIEDFISRKEIWMSVTEAKEFGLIDEVV